MCLSHLNEDSHCISFRLECNNNVWEKLLLPDFFLAHQFIFNLSYMASLLLLLPRFCYAEIVGLALFVLWLRWSLLSVIYGLLYGAKWRLCSLLLAQYLSFLVTSCQSTNLVDFITWSIHQKFCTLCVAWCYHEHQKKKPTCKHKKTTLFFSHLYSFLFITATFFFLPVAVSCLQLNCHNCHMNPHTCYQSLVAFCLLFSSVFVYQVHSG